VSVLVQESSNVFTYRSACFISVVHSDGILCGESVLKFVHHKHWTAQDEVLSDLQDAFKVLVIHNTKYS
jgi:hypothetical protein